MVGEIENGRLLVAYGDDYFEEIIDWLKEPLDFADELGVIQWGYVVRQFLEDCGVEVEATEWDGGMPGMSGTYLYGWIDADGKDALLREIHAALVPMIVALKAGKSQNEREERILDCIQRGNHTSYAPWLQARIRRLKRRCPEVTDEDILDALALQNISYQDISVEVRWGTLSGRDDLWEEVCRNLDVPATRRYKKVVPFPEPEHVGEIDQDKRILVATGWGSELKSVRFDTFHPAIEKLVVEWRKGGHRSQKSLRQFLESLGLTIEIKEIYGDLCPDSYDIKAWISSEDASKFKISRRRKRGVST